MRRRDCLRGMAAWLVLPMRSTRAAEPSSVAEYAPVIAGRPIRFPHDEGAHPEFRTEWWYVTGWLNESTSPLGFQITFFRTRPHPDSGNPSRFAPRDIIIAHAAVSERAHGRLRHAQRVARAGFGLAEAATDRMDVKLDHWRMHADAGHYIARIETNDFELDLRLERTQAPLLQGDAGYSRKGPKPASASYYYSHPQLVVAGKLRLDRRRLDVAGSAWLDHEWSSEYLDPDAVGWDWIGINLDDGGALMAFRMRDRNGAQHWASATYRTAAGVRRSFSTDEVRWEVVRRWRSPRTGADYPVAVRVHVGDTRYDVEPMFDDQESDSRITTGAIYWEGAVVAKRDGRRVGRGYLELTGYAGKLRL